MAVAQGRTGNYVVFPGYAKLFTLLERNEQPLAALEGLGRGALRERFPGGGSGFRGGRERLRAWLPEWRSNRNHKS